MKKQFIILISIFSILSPTTTFAKDLCTIAVSTATVEFGKNAEAIMPMSDIIIWKYKIISGNIYRRRYNTTKKQWIGDWELVP